jgi:vacuolar protein sorting-associated protein 16
LTASSNLWVITSDFQRKVLEFDISDLQSDAPTQIGWCGSDAILISYPTVVILLGPGGETLQYYYTSTPHLITEPDGTRIISATECDFVQRVPESSEKVFRPGSTAPAAFLFDASESFAKRNVGGSGRGVGGRADESVRAMRPDLASAVYSCIDAAGREWDVLWQRKLLGVSRLLYTRFKSLARLLTHCDSGS